MRTIPLRSAATLERSQIDNRQMADIVLHFSLPAFDEFGGPVEVRSDEIESGKTLLSGGEVLISRLNPRKPRIQIVPDAPHLQVVASTEFVALRPRTGFSRRWIAYALQSESSRQFLDSHVRSATRSHQRVDPSEIARLRIADLPVEDQRRIADFLDASVASIDSIVVARRKQTRFEREAFLAELDHLLCGTLLPTRPLQVLTDPRRPIQYGIVLPGPDFSGGVPIIKGGDIGSGRLARLELNRTDPQIERAYARSRVMPGDFVISIRGSFGEIAAVPDELAVANLTQDSARIAPHACDATWLEHVLIAPTVQSEIERRATGSTVRGINIGDLRRVPIPVPDQSSQRKLGWEANRLRTAQRSSHRALTRSVELLIEYKQSLITAAVTGELDVTTASTKLPA